MIQMRMLGGQPPSEVGLFQQISEIQQNYRRLGEEMAADNTQGIAYRATAAGTLKMRDVMASVYSPVDTGTLSAAHTNYMQPEGEDRLVGVVYINPSIVNPVYHKKPSVYGPDLIERGYDWPTRAMHGAGDEIARQITDTIGKAVVGIFT